MRDPPIWLRSHGGGNVDLHLANFRRTRAAVASASLHGGVNRRPGARRTANQGIRAVSCSTRFLGWKLCGWVAALMCG
jgi:hypothetical protein